MPKARRLAAEFIIDRFGLSQRRACALAVVSRTALTYAPRRSALNDQLQRRLHALAERFRRYGHARLHVLLRREGFPVNHKRTERLYRAAHHPHARRHHPLG